MVDFTHFHEAQAPVIAAVEAELRAGRKRTHWMWFVFPQLKGLGASPMAQRFALHSLAEARDYLADPVLGGRLRTLTEVIIGLEGRSIHDVFGSPDDMKFRSSMTLFDLADSAGPFRLALERFYEGRRDPLTLQLLEEQRHAR